MNVEIYEQTFRHFVAAYAQAFNERIPSIHDSDMAPADCIDFLMGPYKSSAVAPPFYLLTDADAGRI